MVTGVVLATEAVFTVNIALLLPPATVTLVSPLTTEGLLLLSVTTAPPLGAGLLNTTVPWELPPPTTLIGLSVTDVTALAVNPNHIS
jgi:hypothetical protein